MSDDSALEAIAPIEETVVIAGNTIHVKPLTVGQLPAFTRAVGPAVPALEALFKSAQGGDVSQEEILYALGSTESLIEAVRVAAGLERKWLDAQNLDALVTLAGAVFQVNADFFGRALAPVAVEVFGRAVKQATGTESSPGSSDSDSPGPTFSG